MIGPDLIPDRCCLLADALVLLVQVVRDTGFHEFNINKSVKQGPNLIVPSFESTDDCFLFYDVWIPVG
jgi:hypothetical protein